MAYKLLIVVLLLGNAWGAAIACWMLAIGASDNPAIWLWLWTHLAVLCLVNDLVRKTE